MRRRSILHQQSSGSLSVAERGAGHQSSAPQAPRSPPPSAVATHTSGNGGADASYSPAYSSYYGQAASRHVSPVPQQQQQQQHAYYNDPSSSSSGGGSTPYRYDTDGDKYAKRKRNFRRRFGPSSSSSSFSSWVYLSVGVLLLLVGIGIMMITIYLHTRPSSSSSNASNHLVDSRISYEDAVNAHRSSSIDSKSVVGKRDQIDSSVAKNNNKEENEETKLRGGMTKEERAAAALLLADIIVHAEHEVEEELLQGSTRLKEDDGDYLKLMGSKTRVRGAGYAYLPYEIDALDCSSFGVSAWIKPNAPSGSTDAADGKRNRVIWSTLPPGACGSSVPSPVAGENMHDDIAGQELAINETGYLKLIYVDTRGNCQTITTSEGNMEYGKWNHVGVIVGKRIALYRNGQHLKANGVSAARAQHSHKDPITPTSLYRPKGKMVRTFIGQREDGSDVLDASIALLSIWTSQDEFKLHKQDIMRSSYEAGKRKDSVDNAAESGFDNGSPTYFYPFDGETLHSQNEVVSSAREILVGKGRHGTIRRYIRTEQYEKSGAFKYTPYITGTYEPEISARMKGESDEQARHHRAVIRNAFLHAWDGYRTQAWGYDELLPISGGTKDNWGGMATTMIDSLSTLWLMGLKEEFWEARDYLQKDLDFDQVGTVSVFETTIRVLGGLLSAYDLSGDSIFLEKADDLGSRLMKAFNTRSGIPYGEAVLNGTPDQAHNTPWHSNSAVLSELGTLQLEFRYLSKATGKREYEKAAMKVIDVMEKLKLPNGLYYVFVTNESPQPQYGNQKISIGALGDSFYEYLLKMWLQGDKKERQYRRLYDEAMDGLHETLLQTDEESKLTYVAELDTNRIVTKQDHLSCFIAGNLALGAYTNPKGLDSDIARRDLRSAKAIAYTCFQKYRQSKTGMAPEAVLFGSRFLQKQSNAKYNILRPETAESLYILYTLTGDPVYREWGWEIFTALQQYCKTDFGFGSLKDVDNDKAPIDDKMESFFLAETLKYLYLLQDPDNEIDILRKHIFNTEAHPLKIMSEM